MIEAMKEWRLERLDIELVQNFAAQVVACQPARVHQVEIIALTAAGSISA